MWTGGQFKGSDMKAYGRLATGASLIAILLAGQAAGAPLTDADRTELLAGVQAREAPLADAALKIWGFAELGYQETRSTALLQQQLKAAGFEIKPGVAGMPTAFVASFKNGPGPVVAVLAEFDALPGLAQHATPTRSPIPGQAGGHGCGHNLFGAASVNAAIALKAWMQAHKIAGELRVYGTPAEEGGSAKAYMVRDGLFSDVDVALHWHPGNENSAAQTASKANLSGKFRFRGISSHASGSPDKGRSALDGVELMDAATNMLREHVPDGTRIHYVITDGGKAPNVVPDFAEVYYYVRHRDPATVLSVWSRVEDAAKGAALATGVKVDWEITGGVYSMLPNHTLGRVMDANLRRVGGLTWTAAETAFATTLAKSLPNGGGDLASAAQIQPYDGRSESGGSTDVSDVSWVVPTVGLSTATFVPGSPGHSWQNAAAAGSTIGVKGAVAAAKTLALTGAEVFTSPELIAAAKAELAKSQGPNFRYKAMVGDRKPPLDYRKGGSGE
jgi:aminobenzoyl-glutamate utilization protein B